jgi:hypothetical protein
MHEHTHKVLATAQRRTTRCRLKCCVKLYLHIDLDMASQNCLCKLLYSTTTLHIFSKTHSNTAFAPRRYYVILILRFVTLTAKVECDSSKADLPAF